MKLIVAMLVAIAATLALTVSSGFAAPDTSQICTSLADVGLSHGQCVAAAQELRYSFNGNKDGQGATDPVEFCKQLDGTSKLFGGGGLHAVGITFGECVNFVKAE
jgi:hypothetical protein